MPSFDIISEVNEVELRNALEQTNKEVGTRFDFRGSDARVEHTENTLTVFADDNFKINQVYEVLLGKLAKRGVDVRCMVLFWASSVAICLDSVFIGQMLVAGRVWIPDRGGRRHKTRRAREVSVAAGDWSPRLGW